MPRESITNYELTDTDLERLVTEALAWEEKLPYQNIRVRADEGVVLLAGTVETPEQKIKAVKTAEGIAGVTCVTDNLGVRPPHRVQDEEIEQAVRERIERDGRLTSPEDFEVLVKNRIVHLRGEVTSIVEKWAALDDARSVPGVKDVSDEIVLIPQVTISDHILEHLVTAELTRLLGLDARNIHAHVENQVVRLQGTLHSGRQKSIAQQVASEIMGIRGVINDITIAE
ncbi:MAG: BON domain-containing protein [Armatimonadota bacterium]